MPLRDLDIEQGQTRINIPHSQLLWGGEERTVVVSSNWVAGVLLFLFLAGLLPLSLLVLASVLLVCLATCIRAYVVHQFEQTVNSTQGVSSLTEALQMVSAAGPLFVAGQSIDLNNLRLSLIQRDFGASDYDRLLALDSAEPLAACRTVSEEKLAALQTFRHSRRSSSACKKGEEHLCCVCLEAFAEGAVVTQLNCKHSFHGDCIQPWLRQQGIGATCPLCKAAVWSQK